ncbi:uncharacterized protein K460DRAFT_68926 [Cucurbitaria berberidis CBS 394.84]|uniref:SH3 domain-containing protein n=1 Tax=Cucurbitaria berberidis CBS 394.84 TaxID=1168544 RepID=A0A9P4LAM6_9PLEO|nr:uncharacterized protein K460DRAFT_68926 [Cucurbitaria berberidis CBS 394.84]KAF1848195.1 hypothetical protein K460DRAFT_68926 [Cucurbitaria berberidis CBS 394.84]
MAHNHAQSHLVRRQRFRDQDEDDSEFATTVISVEFVSAPNTDTGRVVWVTQQPKTLIAPAVRPRPTSTEEEQQEETRRPTTQEEEKKQSTQAEQKKPSTQEEQKKPSATSRNPSSAHASDAQKTAATSLKQASTLMVATKAPTPGAGSAAAGIASATAAISASASASAEPAAGGMSGGAKAGLAFGILAVLGALLVGILLVYRRKKKQMVDNTQNEKIDLNNAPPPPPPQVLAPAGPAPSIRTNRTMSTAPRLSLRPVTQFDPAFNEQRKSGGNLLNVAAAGGAAAAHNREQSDRPKSAWERPGAPSTPTANPFNDPENRPNPLAANPFGNNSALDVHQAAIPDSPPNASPMHSTQPSNDFAKPVPAVPAAEIDPVAMAGAMSSMSPATNEFPPPPAMAINTAAVPPSPAWTEDFPASPGPAPTGPPPVAGVMGGGRSNSPAPGPDNVHRIQLDFKASMQDELDLQAGQLVRMLHEYDDGWALCIRMDRSQQGVVPRTCLSKHPVKPRTGPPRQGPPPPGMRGPPIRSPMGPGGIPQPRPLSPASGRNSPGPQSPNGPMSPSQRSMSPGPRQMSPRQMQGPPRGRANSNAPQYGPPRGRSNSNAPYAQPQRSMSPGPYGGGPQMAPPPQMGRPRSNSASQAGNPRRGPAPGPSPMNPSAGPMPPRKPVPGMAM